MNLDQLKVNQVLTGIRSKLAKRPFKVVVDAITPDGVVLRYTSGKRRLWSRRYIKKYYMLQS